MNLGESIRSGVKWLLLGNTGGQFLQFAFGVALARLLVPADFGMILTIQVFTGFVSMLASGGMGQSLIRAKTVDITDFHAVFSLQLLLGIIIYVGFFFSAPWIARFFDDPLYLNLLRVSALSFLLRPFTLIRISWLTREMQFKTRSLIDLIISAFTGVCSVLMAAGGLGVWSLTLAGLIGGIASNILFFFITPLRIRLIFRPDIVRKHGAYGFKITLNEFLNYLKNQIVNLIVSKLAGPALLGLFNKADSLARMPNRLITPPTNQTVFRAMSITQNDLDKTKYMFFRTITLMMVYILPGLVCLWWLGEPFIKVIYGEKWLPAAAPLKILVFAGALRIIAAPCGVLLAAQNRLTQVMVGQLLELLFVLVACIIGLSWGLVGVAYALLASTIFATIYGYILVSRVIYIRPVEVFTAIVPALLLNAVLLLYLAGVEILSTHVRSTMPALYLSAMLTSAVLVYGFAFLYLPIPSLKSEVDRWRHQILNGLRLMPWVRS